jgi:hypothetical protein
MSLEEIRSLGGQLLSDMPQGTALGKAAEANLTEIFYSKTIIFNQLFMPL